MSDCSAAFHSSRWQGDVQKHNLDRHGTLFKEAFSEREARIDSNQDGRSLDKSKYEYRDYDVVGIGNHEFNFGLEYLDSAIASDFR